MKYILDTNAVSALMKGDETVLARLRKISRTNVFVPQPVIAEISYGIQRLARSKRREALRARFELLKDELGRATWDDRVSEAFGVIKAALERRGERIEDFDAAVAAHTAAEGYTLITANVRHMARVSGIEIQDWSESSATP